MGLFLEITRFDLMVVVVSSKVESRGILLLDILNSPMVVTLCGHSLVWVMEKVLMMGQVLY